MDLSQKTVLPLTENFVSVQEPLIKVWFDVPTTQMSIFILFVSVPVLFDGAFSLWVSLKGLHKFFVL